ncbi:hypothetical protein MRU69_00185 [Kocuria flava]|nr:hypothetical protein [Kocuria flava]
MRGRAPDRDGPDQRWVTDIAGHPAREDQVYCAVVPEVFSRRVMGWPIGSSPTAALTAGVLSTAVLQPPPAVRVGLGAPRPEPHHTLG